MLPEKGVERTSMCQIIMIETLTPAAAGPAEKLAGLGVPQENSETLPFS